MKFSDFFSKLGILKDKGLTNCKPALLLMRKQTFVL